MLLLSQQAIAERERAEAMATSFQYIPRSNYPVRVTVEQRFIDNQRNAYEIALRNAYEIAFNAIDAQYGSLEDAIVLIEDIVTDPFVKYDAIEAARDLIDALNEGIWALGDSFDEVYPTING